MNDIDERIEAFDDSKELAKALRRIARKVEAYDSYFVMESAVSIEGMWELLKEIKSIDKRKKHERKT